MKKKEEKENIYYDIEGNEIYDANTRTFLMDIPEEVRPLLIECMDKRISIKGIANTRLDYDTIHMFIQKGVLAGINDLEIWKIANSEFTPEVMEYALVAARKNVYFTNIEFCTRVNTDVLFLTCLASEQGINLSDRVTPITTVANLKRILWLRLLFQGRLNTYKQIMEIFEAVL